MLGELLIWWTLGMILLLFYVGQRPDVDIKFNSSHWTMHLFMFMLGVEVGLIALFLAQHFGGMVWK